MNVGLVYRKEQKEMRLIDQRGEDDFMKTFFSDVFSKIITADKPKSV
jgi:energy-converting hydrogenase A subunit M